MALTSRLIPKLLCRGKLAHDSCLVVTRLGREPASLIRLLPNLAPAFKSLRLPLV